MSLFKHNNSFIKGAGNKIRPDIDRACFLMKRIILIFVWNHLTAVAFIMSTSITLYLFTLPL